MTTKVILQVKQLKRNSREGQSLLEPLSFEIQSGEQIALSGTSGSGKTVLLRALAMLEPIQGGEILWKGSKVTHSLVPKYRQDIHYLHQTPVLIEGTVKENLLLPFRFLDEAINSENEIQDKLEELIQMANKDLAFLERRTDVLSGGEKQIVALLRSFLVDPSLLLLDEPTSALDGESTRNIETLIQNWFKQEGKSYLWVSHDAQQLKRVSLRHIQMDQGKLVSS